MFTIFLEHVNIKHTKNIFREKQKNDSKGEK